jgi:transposase InsO family protein
MAYEIVKGQSKETRGRVRELLNKLSVEDPGKTNAKRERFLALLKSRYGYTNEKAVDELERLLKQFYRMNRSLSIHRARPTFKHPHDE